MSFISVKSCPNCHSKIITGKEFNFTRYYCKNICFIGNSHLCFSFGIKDNKIISLNFPLKIESMDYFLFSGEDSFLGHLSYLTKGSRGKSKFLFYHEKMLNLPDDFLSYSIVLINKYHKLHLFV